jgi:hypothetical protein
MEHFCRAMARREMRSVGVRGRLKVGGFGYVKGEDGVSSCDGEVW